MANNIGKIEQLLRIGLGAILLGWVILFQGPGWAWSGLVPLATGLIQWCPLYSLVQRLRK